MRRQETTADTTEGPPAFDHNADRYPGFSDVVERLRDEIKVGNGPVERVEITCLPSGEATYRVWEPRAEEPQGGYLPPTDGL